jgi:hypothetical protein
MPWHLSKSDPRKVYDERHEVVCICATAEQAAGIVGAVNGPNPQLWLREPVEARAMDSFETDYGCCGSHITKASRDGVLKSVTSWECPKCGCEWTPTQNGAIRHWSPKPAVIILKR